MKLWIDTEFTNFKGDLISMAIIDENDKVFYEVLEVEPSQCDPWVVENVLPILYKAPIPLYEFHNRLWEYLKEYKSIHLIADWPDDIKYFCDVLHTSPGNMMNIASVFTMEVCRRLPQYESAIPHNALEDAIAIKKVYMQMENRL